MGEVLKGRRDEVLLATKVRMPMGRGPNDAGLSRHHVISGCEASLRRLGTDHIDLYQVHEWDGQTPLEETLQALDLLVTSGKVRYIGASNYAAWQLMKALGTAERLGLPQFVSQQIYYSLQAREAEYELIPLASTRASACWSGARWPAACCRASTAGVTRRRRARGSSPAGTSRRSTTKLYDIIDVLVEIAGRTASRRPGGAGLPAGQAGRHLGDDWRADCRAAGRQPGRRVPGPHRRRAGPARPGQRATAALSLLAPGQDARDRLSPADLTLLAPYLR